LPGCLQERAMTNKFLVTGGAGFVGSNICRELVRRDCFVRVIDNLLTGRESNLADIRSRIDFVKADMGDYDVARNAMVGMDVVLHQGALPSVPRSIEDPAACHRHCADATFNLLLAARDSGIKRFVYAASSSAYGDTPTLPKVETMRPNPLSPYAAAKLMGEYYCSVFYKAYGLQTVSLRYFNVFGPYQDPASQYAAAIPAFVTSIMKGQSPVVYGDGEQTRDFTYVVNVVHANLLAATAAETKGEVVNIACGERISVNGTISLINELLGTSVAPRYMPARVGDVKHSLADIGLAGQVLGFAPVVSFRDGLRNAIEWYRANLVSGISGRH
jgi:nucleoside-diphosphate-sugar epimerase